MWKTANINGKREYKVTESGEKTIWQGNITLWEEKNRPVKQPTKWQNHSKPTTFNNFYEHTLHSIRVFALFVRVTVYQQNTPCSFRYGVFSFTFPRPFAILCCLRINIFIDRRASCINVEGEGDEHERGFLVQSRKSVCVRVSMSVWVMRVQLFRFHPLPGSCWFGRIEKICLNFVSEQNHVLQELAFNDHPHTHT